MGLVNHFQIAASEVSWTVYQLDCGGHLLRRLKFITQTFAPPLANIQGITKWRQFEKHWFRQLWRSPAEAWTPWLCSIILKKTLPVRRTELEPINDCSQPMGEKKEEKEVLLVSWQTQNSFTGAEYLCMSVALAKEQLPVPVTQFNEA